MAFIFTDFSLHFIGQHYNVTSQNHSANPTAMAAAAAAAAGGHPGAAAAFFGQYPTAAALFDPARTSHLDWHLHAASFHSAQGMRVFSRVELCGVFVFQINVEKLFKLQERYFS